MPIADRTFATPDELEDTLALPCRGLERQRPAVKACYRYRRWPRERRLWNQDRSAAFV